MTIERNTWVERALIAFNRDGTVRGAQQERLERVTDGADVLSEKYLPAEAISADALQGALGAQLAAMIEQNAAQALQIADLSRALAEVEAAKAAAEAEVTRLSAALNSEAP